ncbi:hypothetical protein D6F66_24515, partial [Salmonella enterica]|nr:hypothetical protein [Salmonella enterica]
SLTGRMTSQGEKGAGDIRVIVPACAGLRRFYPCATCNYSVPPFMPLARHQKESSSVTGEVTSTPKVEDFGGERRNHQNF